MKGSSYKRGVVSKGRSFEEFRRTINSISDPGPDLRGNYKLLYGMAVLVLGISRIHPIIRYTQSTFSSTSDTGCKGRGRVAISLHSPFSWVPCYQHAVWPWTPSHCDWPTAGSASSGPG